MSHAQSKKRLLQAFFASLAIGVIGISVVLAEDVWVNSAAAQIKDGKFSFSAVVADVPQGTKLTVIERDGDWLHVQYQDKDGWISNDSLSSQKVNNDAMANLNDHSSSGMTTANAGKGFEAHDYALQKNYDEAPLKNLEALIPTLINGPEFTKFMADGKIGLSKPKT